MTATVTVKQFCLMRLSSSNVINQNSMFWNFEPCDRWFLTVLPSPVEDTHWKQLSLSLSPNQIVIWPLQSFSALQPLGLNIETLFCDFREKNSLAYTFLWFHVLMILYFFFCRQFIFSDEPNGENETTIFNASNCCMSQSIFSITNTCNSHLWTVSFF